MKTHRVFRTLFAGMLLFATLGIAQDSQKLEYKFEKGKTYLFSVVTSGNMTQEMAGQEMKFSNGSRLTIRTVADSPMNDALVLIISADSAVSSSRSPMRDTTMEMTNMIGKRMKVLLSKKGDVVSREIIDTVVFQSQMQGGGVQREMISFLSLPSTPVKNGEKWTSTRIDTIESMGGKIVNTIDYEFSLAGKEMKMGHDCLKIPFTGKSMINGNMKMMGMELFMEGTGTTSGTLYFDPSKGLPVLVETIADSETTMAATGQQQMTIPITQSTKSTTTLVKD